MKKLISIFCLFFAITAHADKRGGTSESHVRTVSTTDGEDAQRIYVKIKTPAIPGEDTAKYGNIEYKVKRSKDGLDQTVCTHKTSFATNEEVFHCKQQHSETATPIPEFEPND